MCLPTNKSFLCDMEKDKKCASFCCIPQVKGRIYKWSIGKDKPL